MNVEITKSRVTKNFVRYTGKTDAAIITVYVTPDRVRTPAPETLLVTITDPGFPASTLDAAR